MITFSEFMKLKSKDLFGTEIRKTEQAGIRAIVETAKENERFIVNIEKKKLIEDFVNKLLEKSNGNNIRNQNTKKHKS